MKIYTKTGDNGTTGLLSDRRVGKDDIRIEAYGTVDELNAVLGVVRAAGLTGRHDSLVASLQDQLFIVGSALADPNPGGPFHRAIDADHSQHLETQIDLLEAELAPLSQFILPGGTPAAAQIHLARTVCRRAERLVVRLSNTEGEHVPAEIIIYLNRLSDLLFVLARSVNHTAGVTDVPWSGL